VLMVNLTNLPFHLLSLTFIYYIGDRLALCTKGGYGLHMLRIYDVRSCQPVAPQATALEPFSTMHSAREVNCCSFSSDGLYLAIGRSDDCVHVYDPRMLERGPILLFEHHGSPRNSPGYEPFGIVEVQWASTSKKRLGLISGGTDGKLPLFGS
jgi:WD40 repeat protein